MQGNLNKVEFKIEEIGKIDDGIKYKVSVKAPMNFGWIDNMIFYTESNKEVIEHPLDFIKKDDEYVYFEGEADIKTSASCKYSFSFAANKNNIYLNDEKWKMSVNFNTPDWSKGKIMYHIFVDRFNRGSNEKPKDMPKRTVYDSFDEPMIIGPDKNGIWNADFYGGDLKGVEKKLDYIKSLGVSIIYLSPIVWSQSNHRYDASNYETVDPYLGTNKDLKSLCDKAHQKGIKIILDAVFNHTGNDSIYFNEFNTFDSLGAFQSKDSKYYPFYRKDGNGNFCYWWDMKNLPVCYGYNREWQEYIYGENGVIDKWFSLGIDGLRLDVADELTDEFIEGIRKAVKRNKEDGFIIGEVWKPISDMPRGYIYSGKGMDSVMNYPLEDALMRYFKYCDINKMNEVLHKLLYDYPEEVLLSLMNPTSTHDISRPITFFGSNEFKQNTEWAWNPPSDDRTWQNNYKLTDEEYKKGKEIYKSYIYSLAFFPGILSIFYGDELGLEGMGNLANRKPFPKEIKDEELLKFFQQIGRIRNEEKFLETAKTKVLDVNDRYFMYEREKDNEKALVAVNRTGDEQKIILPEGYSFPDKVYNLNNSKGRELTPHGGLVLKKVRR